MGLSQCSGDQTQTNAIARDSTSELQLFQTLDLKAKVQEPLPENLRRREATLLPVH